MLKSLHDISVSDQMWELGFNICPRLVSLHENSMKCSRGIIMSSHSQIINDEYYPWAQET